MATVKTVSIDLGADQLFKEIEALKKQFVDIGVQSDAGTRKKTGKGKTAKNVIVAATHEFGTDKAGRNKNIIIPERSFLRSTMDEKEGDFRKDTSNLIESIKAGNETAKGLLQKMGLIIESAIKAKIKSNIPPPLKYREGTALWDTGQLINSIRYVSSLGGESPKL